MEPSSKARDLVARGRHTENSGGQTVISHGHHRATRIGRARSHRTDDESCQHHEQRVELDVRLQRERPDVPHPTRANTTASRACYEPRRDVSIHNVQRLSQTVRFCTEGESPQMGGATISPDFGRRQRLAGGVNRESTTPQGSWRSRI